MEIQAPWLRPIVDMVKFILNIEKGAGTLCFEMTVKNKGMRGSGGEIVKKL